MSELERAPREGGGGVTRYARGDWTPEQTRVIASTVAQGATPPQIRMFLEVAAKYDLDPLLREIWCAVPKLRNGEYNPEKTMIFTGRDGFLKVAQRHEDFRGLSSNAIYANDTFWMQESSGGVVEFEHRINGLADRGELLGAWAEARREGRPPRFFLATLGSFKPSEPPSGSSWAKGEELMILKCAESHALKKQFAITGLYSEGEVDRFRETGGETPVVGSAEQADFEWGDDDVLALYLQRLFHARNASSVVEAYTAAKVRLVLADLDDEGRRALAARLEDELRRDKVELPPMPTQEEVDAAKAAEEVVEAELVEDAGAAGSNGDAPETTPDSGGEAPVAGAQAGAPAVALDPEPDPLADAVQGPDVPLPSDPTEPMEGMAPGAAPEHEQQTLGADDEPDATA